MNHNRHRLDKLRLMEHDRLEWHRLDWHDRLELHGQQRQRIGRFCKLEQHRWQQLGLHSWQQLGLHNWRRQEHDKQRHDSQLMEQLGRIHDILEHDEVHQHKLDIHKIRNMGGMVDGLQRLRRKQQQQRKQSKSKENSLNISKKFPKVKFQTHQFEHFDFFKVF